MAAYSLAIVSISFMVFFAAGCKKKVETQGALPEKKLESVFTNRMNDAAYVEALRKNRTEQGLLAKERFAVMTQLKACQDRVKAALPANADEAVLKAALARDPEWQKLNAQKAQGEGRDQAKLAEARETIRKRMETEAQAKRAVSEGKAKALDPEKAK